MKKSVILLMLITVSVTENLFAQRQADQGSSGPSSSPFYVPASAIMDSFYVKLDYGNSLQIAVSNLADIGRPFTPDALIRAFRDNMAAFEDSLSNPLTIKKISYLTDGTGKIFIRLQQFKPHGNSYLINKGEKAVLKIAQDTVIMMHVLTDTTRSGCQAHPEKRYLRLTFQLNDFHQLYDYQSGELDSAFRKLYQAARSRTHWSPKNNHHMKLEGSYSLAGVRAGQPAVIHPRYKENDFVTPLLAVNLQNVYQHLSPSASLGVLFDFPRRGFAHELSLSWEPMFLFALDNRGVWQTYRNDWLMARYSIYAPHAEKKAMFTGNLSVSYLIRRKGDFFDKNTFRLGLGGFRKDKLTLEPVIYFHDFFRGVTPGLRLGVSF
jgi:hypothetical protein